ncbi:MAG: serine/threonine protein kinase [Deltaproteobacteria bacterium]|nr:serine/threonine protein kinase [Deltaproteobacteria bacterium]
MGEIEAGTMVNANVRLTELLAEGGMGSVWRADHLSLQTEVAVKVIAPHLAGKEPTLRQRFKREAAICAQLRSTHVVQIFDHGETEDGVPFIVMELLEGEPLTDQIERDGPMRLPEVGTVVDQVAKVLHRAHVIGIVHRDIKPDNIFLTESDYELFVKVLDFGISKQTRLTKKDDSVTKTGMVVGTVEFMSPEQAVSSKHIGFESDLWSLGVVAYYALTATLPFDPESGEPIWLQMTKGRVIPPSSRRSELSPAVDDWIARALQPKPKDRFPSAKAMAEELIAVIEEPFSERIDRLAQSMADDPSTVDQSDPPVDEDDEETMRVRIDHLDERWGKSTVHMNEDDHRQAEDAGEDPEDFARTSKRAAPGKSPSPHSDSDDAGPLSGSFDPLPGEGFAGPPISQGSPSVPEGMGDGPLSSPELAGPPTAARTGEVTHAEPRSRLPMVAIIVVVLAVAAALVWQFLLP